MLVALLLPVAGGAGMLQRFETDDLAIRTQDGALHRFTVELAVTPEQRSQGLMYRRELAADRGMLFLYPRPGYRAMWMKNTYIPLDMLFIKSDGRVAHIAERTEPHSLQSISAGERVSAVLELRGGTADRLGISEGAVVLHRAFGTGEGGS
jgi:hypothetical protein